MNALDYARDLGSDEDRAALRASIWNALGMHPQATRSVVRANADAYVRNFDDDGSDTALEDAAIRTVIIIAASYDLGNPIGDGSATLAAHDLGDGYYYSTDDVNDGTLLRAAIPKELAPQAFVDEERDFAWQMFSNGGYPTVLKAASLNQTWFRRLMVQGIAAWSIQEPSAVPELLEHIDRYMNATDATCDEIKLARYWHEMVTQNPQSTDDSVPTELAADVPISEAFEAWLGNVRLFWTDTLEPVDRADATIARLVCRYLAANVPMSPS
jgi:hypothetical protein